MRYSGQPRKAGCVVGMLVGQKHGVDRVDWAITRFQHLTDAAAGEPGVNEDPAILGDQERAVAGAAATEDLKTDRHPDVVFATIRANSKGNLTKHPLFLAILVIFRVSISDKSPPFDSPMAGSGLVGRSVWGLLAGRTYLQ